MQELIRVLVIIKNTWISESKHINIARKIKIKVHPLTIRLARSLLEILCYMQHLKILLDHFP